MKKLIIILSMIISILSIYKTISKEEQMIRFRVIANSNQEEDQEIKKKVVKSISNIIINKSIQNIEEERNYLKDNIPLLEEKIEGITNDYKINYGNNYFPEKQENGKTYKEGVYESLVITLGEGKGDNFWCILFPPLCMIEEEEKTEYKSFIKEALTKFF